MRTSNWCKLGGLTRPTVAEVTAHQDLKQVFVVLTRHDRKRLLVFLDQEEALALGQEIVAAARKVGKQKKGR